nr:GNAT family N-acetyltransferase [uncultured Algibacter sp.]
MHLGMYHKDKIIAVCTFIKQANPNILETQQYQLRGMAVTKPFQGKGLGGIILRYGENLLIKKSVKIVWCNAREVAINFYKKSGYQIIGESFNIKDVGLHYSMYKTL